MIFFSVGIGYMIMGILYFARNKFNLHTTAAKVYKIMFYSGVLMIIFGIGNLIFKHYIWMILYAVNMFAMICINGIILKNWIESVEVMDELTKTRKDN